MTAGRPPSVDASLRRRRRAIEACAFAARGIGLLSTLGVALIPASGLTPALRATCYGGVVLMAAANVLSLAAFRRPGAARYPWFSAAQIVLDTVLSTGMVAVFAAGDGRTTWPLLAVPIVVAAIRHELRAALAVWVVTSASYAVVAAELDDRTALAEDLPFAVCLHLLIALVTGTQSAAFRRQLADLQATRLALQHQATHDGLTGLPNRARLAGHADQHAGRPMAVLLLDLDGFKPINDTRGHAVGDDVLRQVAGRITGCLRTGDLAGRLGGDEFLVLLPDGDAGTADHTAQRIRTAVSAPMRVAGSSITVGVSIGAAVRAAGSDQDLAALTAEADTAMYRAKSRRRAHERPGGRPAPAEDLQPI